MMKNIFLFLSLFLVFLLGAKDVNGTLPIEEGVGMECVLQTDVQEEYVLSSAVDLPYEGVAYVDTESLARQFRVCGRGHRSFSVQHWCFGKVWANRSAMKHLEMLSHSSQSIYTSLPCQSWAVSSDHYIFGMRRILI